MFRLLVICRGVLVMGALGAMLSGCFEPHAELRRGDANSAEVAYSGDDEGAIRVARQHCARFERVPQLIEKGPDNAYFECVHR